MDGNLRVALGYERGRLPAACLDQEASNC